MCDFLRGADMVIVKAVCSRLSRIKDMGMERSWVSFLVLLAKGIFDVTRERASEWLSGVNTTGHFPLFDNQLT